MTRFVLQDEQWDRIKDLLPGKVTDCGVTAKDNRLFVEAVLWMGRTGAPRRDLPPELGNWHSTFTRFARWTKSGVWDRVLEAMSADRDLEEVLMDSTAIRAHHHAAGAKKNTAHRLWVALAVGSEAKFMASLTPSVIPSDSR